MKVWLNSDFTHSFIGKCVSAHVFSQIMRMNPYIRNRNVTQIKDNLKTTLTEDQSYGNEENHRYQTEETNY